MGSHYLLMWIAYYGLVVAALLPVVKFCEGTIVGAFFRINLCFVVFVPILLLRFTDRGHRWADRLMDWHAKAAGGILVISTIAMFVRWLAPR